MYAAGYYNSLVKEVEITGTKERDYFEVKQLGDEGTHVTIYPLNSSGEKEAVPYYLKIFVANETKEIRLYGLDGNDVYSAEGQANNGIKIRIIGGPATDSITDRTTGANKWLHIYDNNENVFDITDRAKKHLSSDTSIHSYRYDAYKGDKSGFKPTVFYSNEDRFYVSLGYQSLKHAWRKEPFRSKQGIYLNYSLSQRALSIYYTGIVNQFIGKWNLGLNAMYDFVRWTNFYGIGNETRMETMDRNFYRMRTREFLGSVGLNRKLGEYHKIGFSGFFQTVNIINDKERFISRNLTGTDLFSNRYFAGGRFDYLFNNVNDPVLPSKGLTFFGNATYTQDVQEQNRDLMGFAGNLYFYLPLARKLILAVRTGGATVNGKPQFYQLPTIGGGQTLRGYRRDRFYGKTTFYNSNELQWVTNLKSTLFNGRIGLIALYDIGRVWQPNENSDQWHRGYGGGFLMVPFEKIMVSVTYGKSNETGLFHLRFSKSLQ
jgi:hypothetical protein